MTYRDVYADALETMLLRGGPEGTVDKLHGEYTFPTTEGLRQWLAGRVLICANCERSFPADPPMATLESRVTCEGCR